MEIMETDIIILRGAPGSGKSLSAKSLTKYFPKGVRIEIDNIRSMVISVDWTNQDEHISILNISTKLVYDFIKLDLKPIIVVDTFNGDKVKRYIDELSKLDNTLSIKVFGLFTTESELEKRINARTNGEFKDFNICKKLNADVHKFKYDNEILIDTTGVLPVETAKIIYNDIKKNHSCPAGQQHFLA